ncbi:hypothetical protein OHA74_06035 [Streptomyces phaeochromogenes]|nr:hypothetical protein [Streptomyces phaeochromogenes]
MAETPPCPAALDGHGIIDTGLDKLDKLDKGRVIVRRHLTN